MTLILTFAGLLAAFGVTLAIGAPRPAKVQAASRRD